MNFKDLDLKLIPKNKKVKDYLENMEEGVNYTFEIGKFKNDDGFEIFEILFDDGLESTQVDKYSLVDGTIEDHQKLLEEDIKTIEKAFKEEEWLCISIETYKE